jgi:glycosyltransferase involved in cell wall biosynthesis
VLTEALAHGVPVVATRAGAIPETLPASACRLVTPGDVAALARVLEQLIGGRDERSVLAEGARAARQLLVPWPQAVSRWGAAVAALTTRRIS